MEPHPKTLPHKQKKEKLQVNNKTVIKENYLIKCWLREINPERMWKVGRYLTDKNKIIHQGLKRRSLQTKSYVKKEKDKDEKEDICVDKIP